MDDEQEFQLKREERQREKQRVINAYKRTFLSSDGRDVLADLATVFGCDKPVFLAGPDGKLSELHAAIRDGQRSVLLHIAHVVRLEAKGDASVEDSPKVIAP